MLTKELKWEQCELFLLPENEPDRLVLERILENYEVSGFGRHAETGKLLHVEIPLTRKESSNA